MTDRRTWFRFDTLCPVTIESNVQEPTQCVARNVSSGGIFLEIREPLPIGSAIRVWFTSPDGARMAGIGEVKHHYFVHYASDEGKTRALTGMGVRFSSFEAHVEGDVVRSPSGHVNA